MTWESWRPKGGSYAFRVRELLRAVMALHSPFSNEIWLWRGQSRWSFKLEPGMHSRVRNTPGLIREEGSVVNATQQLLNAARRNQLDVVEGLRLPDLALLAHLQHHGAATPLLDVTVDPLVALWMVAHARGSDPTSDDAYDGALFGIRRPRRESSWLAPLDSRPYSDGGPGDVATAISREVHWYRAPDISERLRIQRGSFLVGPLAAEDDVTFPLLWKSVAGGGWLTKRIEALGKPGQPVIAQTEVVAFRVGGKLKREVRKWLDERAGLTPGVIYPIPWHRPFLEEFCRSYGRGRPID
jgi:hypothetical protein